MSGAGLQIGLDGIAQSQIQRFIGNLRRARARLDGRDQTPTVSKWAQYKSDPVGFARDILGYHLWSKQREICEALVKYDRVAVKSCHQVGKSHVTGGVIVPWWLAVHAPKEAMVVTSAPTFPQVRAILWKEINRSHARGKLPGYTNQTEWLIDNELVAFGRKPQDEDPTAFQGIHARYLLVCLDEACGVPRNLFIAAESLVANDGGKILAIGNPDDPATEFARICQPGSGWHVVTISAFDSPNLTGEDVPDTVRSLLVSRGWVEDKERSWGETSPIYVSKVLGEFPEISEDSLIQPRWVADAINRDIPVQPDDPNELGVDVARHGKNETVIYHRHGSQARLWKAVRQRDTMAVVGLIVQAVIETGASVVKIDDVGVGGGVTDRCKELSREPAIVAPNPMREVQIIGVNVGQSPIERASDRREKIDPRTRFFNQKAQFSWELRERFRTGDIDLGDDLDTQAQACIVKYENDSRGRLRIESKEDIENRLGKLGGASAESGSPDRWDALVLAFADVEEKMPLVISEAALAASRMPSRRRFF